MYDTLFKDRLTIAKHRNGPLSTEREAYLRKRMAEGYSRETLILHARQLLSIAATLKKLSTGVTPSEIARAAKRWTAKHKSESLSEQHFISLATHSLRHACTSRLIDQGFSLKEVGDHLGHRCASVTSAYTKVDLRSLREVAAIIEGGVI